jgi:hypothetical protein
MFMVFIQLLFASFFCEAQTYMWTWIDGNYPFLHPPDSIKNIGNIRGGTAWVDDAGKFWLFGGVKTGTGSFSSIPHSPFTNDLWKWDGGKWFFIKGGNVEGDYGYLGIPAATNLPPARVGCVSWKDFNGITWMFGGGDGFNILFNDLWKWDGNNWTWYGGQLNHGFDGRSEIGFWNYGIKGVASVNNLPQPSESPSNWIDNKGNLWIFGGVKWYLRGYRAYSNDLWKWDGNYWTWISGFGDSTLYNANYGKKGIAATTNMPERRYGSAAWKDNKDQFYFFGGAISNGVGSPGGELLQNDLWKWDGTNWTYLGGGQWVINQIGNTGTSFLGGNTGRYGIRGLPDTANWPTPRRNSAYWNDQEGNFWMYGGLGYLNNQINAQYLISLNDLWEWDGQFWTWISGDSIPSDGFYGIKGVSDIKNQPAARDLSFHWLDTNGNLWFYGGYNRMYYNGGYYFNNLNDMWVYNNGKGIPTAINNPSSPINTGQIILLNNPTKNNQLSLISDQYYFKLNWEIIDLNGIPIQEGTFRMVSKGSRISATTKSLTPGTYFVKLTGDDKSVQTKKWVRF